MRAHIAGSTYVGRQDRLCRLELVPVHWSTSNTKSVILILETSVMYEVVYLSFEFWLPYLNIFHKVFATLWPKIFPLFHTRHPQAALLLHLFVNCKSKTSLIILKKTKVHMHDMQWLRTRSGATAFSLAHNKHTGMFILLTQKQTCPKGFGLKLTKLGLQIPLKN